MFQTYKFVVLHFLIFISTQILGAANIITDLLLSSSNAEPALTIFSTQDFINSKASLYILQYILILTFASGLFIYTLNTSANYLSKKITFSGPWVIHFTISITGCILLLELNAFYFPESAYISLFDISNKWIAGLYIYSIVLALIFALINILNFKIVLLIAFSIGIFNFQLPKTNVHDPLKPNIILISIDSLRPELIPQYMPFLQSQLMQSILYKNSFTSFARTYPSWVSLLTGKHPSLNGAQFNLQNENQLNQSNQYLPKILGDHGYHSVYASDERRFSNLGTTHGFSEIIGPRTGASDFILGNYADSPITNLLTLSPVSQWLLPELYANRAAAHLYRPDSFSKLLEAKIASLPEKPALIATHFCLPHWPYSFVGAKKHIDYADKPLYPSNLIAVDNQIKHLYEALEKSGRLSNSRIVFLSDHGESWGEVDTGLRLDDKPLIINDHGHGMNILSPTSHKVLLAIKGFSKSDSNLDRLASLMDIAPTILEELNLPAIKITGQALQTPPDYPVEISFESGVVLAEANQANPDPRKVAQAGAFRFMLNSDGFLRLKSSEIQHMLTKKQLGLRLDNLGLFALNNSDRYLLINYTLKTAQRVSELNQAPNKLAKRFCQIYGSINPHIKENCGTK